MTADPLHLLKLHGMGNDFLVLVDPDGRHPIGAGLARALCDRHRGVGADGLIRATRAAAGSGAAFAMELLNADGSRAETSGNGLRCLALALALEGAVEGPEVAIATAAGLRRARTGPIGPAVTATVSVEMGSAGLGAEHEVNGRRARLVDMGNPHVVVLVEAPEGVDVGVEGPAEEACHPGGINVNYAAVTGPDRVGLRTWERGAGSTLACGSGSCATAAVLRDWTLVGDRVVVDNPGGPMTVAFEGNDIELSGPAQLIARIEIGPALTGAMVGVGA